MCCLPLQMCCLPLQMCCLPLQSRVCSDHASLISLFCIIQILSSFDMNYSFKREITSILVVSSKFEICQSMPHNCYSLCLLSFLCFLYHSIHRFYRVNICIPERIYFYFIIINDAAGCLASSSKKRHTQRPLRLKLY